MYAKGCTDESYFVGRALETIREFMESDGQAISYQRFIAPATSSVKFSKALNRSVTGSMNELIQFAKDWLIEEKWSPCDIGFKLNEIWMSALRHQRPREAFKALAGGGEALSETAEASRAACEPLEAVSTANSSQEPTISVHFTFAQRRAVADVLPEIANRLKLDEQKARTIQFTRPELEIIRQNAHAAIPNAENGMRRNSFRHVVDAITKAIEDASGIGAIPASERVYQFKITLLEIKPPIWRRIQVKNGTLDKLHEHIQTSMGWTNSHLHRFEIDGVIHGDPELLYEGWQDETPPVNSLITRVSEIIPREGKPYRFRYEYDFGDGWEHEILFEGCLRAKKGERYPVCVEGERACPPEDVGGVWGYAEFLEALADQRPRAAR
jgi:hypothetical protein